MVKFQLKSKYLCRFRSNSFFFGNIENKFKTWRYKNDFIYSFFGRKYLANNFTHYNNDLTGYSKEEKIYIKKNNLLIAHQVILPKAEIERLKTKLNILMLF